MKVAVIGCGGNGGVVAASLAKNRHSPFCIEKGEKIARVLNERGLQLFGKKGKFHFHIRAFPRFSEEMGIFDIIFLGVKSNVLGSVFEEARNYLGESGFIVTIQNGLEILTIAEKFPNTKIVAGAVGYNAWAEEIGKIHVTAQGGITFGIINNAGENDLSLLKSLLEPLITVHTSENTLGLLWTKLLIVCGATGLGGVAGLRVGKLLSYPVARRLFYGMATEGSLLSERLNIKLLKLPGGINPEKFGNHRRGLPLPIRWLILKQAGGKFKHLKSGIQVDLERGNKTEVDYINGAIVREGERVGFDTPVNSLVVRMVKEIEEGHREMGPDNLFEMWNILKRGGKPG
jgi:2-dehydropantoate 2-reductase